MAASMMICGTMSAQQEVKNLERKKVAVVLSGGGAKGMAHVGVLKVLEQAGIPVDIITGTSMGSIIGGLYAIGYNAHSLDSVVRNQDWSYVITDKENLKNQSLSDRKKQNTYIFSTGVSGEKGNMNAGGLISGKNIAELFEKLCWGYTDSLDFSHDLPIPFACVATDIIDNEEYDFHSGRLPQAMRASMAIPAVFSPVRLDGRILVDGGLRNNYPVDIAKEMGADIVIGVSVQGKPKTADDVWSTMSVLGQIIDVNCKNKFEDNKANTDLFINVNPKGYSSASFTASAIDTLIRRGEEETMRHWDELMDLKKRIGIDESFRPTILQPLRPHVMTEKHPIVGCEFLNMTPKDERFLRRKFYLDKLDSIHAALEQEICTSMRVDLFYQTAECRLVQRDSGNVLRLIAGDMKTLQFHAGARYDNEEHAAVQFGLDIPLKTNIPMNTDITLRLGKRLMARGELSVHPTSFTRPTLSCTYYRNDVDIYAEGKRDYNIRYNHFQAEVMPINFDFRHVNLQMGLRWDYMHYRSKLGSSTYWQNTLKNEHFYSYHARLNYNSEDNWYFPTQGTRFKAEFTYLTDNFARLDNNTGMREIDANWRMSLPFGHRFTLQPMLYGRMLFGSVVPAVFGNTIGGEWFGHYVEQQMPFAGIGNMEYVGKQFLGAQLQAQHQLGTNSFVLLRLATAQQADDLKHVSAHRTLFGVQASYYYNALFGPAGGSIGYSNHTKSLYLYLNLGFEF